MFKYKYLTKSHLQGFKKYKYSAVDTSPLSQYVMHPTWNTIVKIIPKWIAPNLITFAGFLCMVAVVFLLWVYDPQLYASGGRPGGEYPNEIPDWLFLLCGVLVFLAYNLDGIDGKQARRIGVSGPLGELFDHGLDSYIVFLIPFAIISIFGRHPVFSVSCLRGFLIVITVVQNFYISHCEKYNTGTLYLPWGYDFSMWVSSLIFIIAGVYGAGVYQVYMYNDLTFAVVFEAFAHFFGITTTLPVTIYNVYLSYVKRSGKMYSIPEAVRPVWAMLTMTVTILYWAVKSPNNVIEYDPKVFIFLYGTLFSNIASRLIIAEMTHQRCDLINWMYWPVLAGVVTSLNLPRIEIPILYTLTILVLFAHIHYGICVVRQICEHYKISCFTVPKDKRK